MSFETDQISKTPTSATDTIDWNSQLQGDVVTYAFVPEGVKTTVVESLLVFDRITSERFNAYEQAQFRTALDMVENVTALEFVETKDHESADLRFMLDTDELGNSALGVFAPPGEPAAGLGIFSGDAWDRTPGGDLEMGGYSFVTIVHETLHGLGFAHPHDTGGGSPVMDGVSAPFDDFGTYDLNQGVYTTMTYNSGLLQDSGVGAVTMGPDWGYEAGPMALDIALLQQKYGVNTTQASGNDIYDLPDQNASGTFWMAIWDTGGTDTIRYQGGGDATIDLRQATLKEEEGGGGYLSAADGIEGGYTIANGVVIENAEGGSGDDAMTGNSAANTLKGQAGDDSLKGGGGEDTLNGNKGDDTLAGSKGDDTLNGGAGDDSLVGQAGQDMLNGGSGDDRLKGGGAEDQLNGQNGKDFLKGGTHDDTLSGNKHDDRLFGNRHDDNLNGGNGNDLLNGGGGDDNLNGGAGDDTLKGGDGADSFVFKDGNDSDVVIDFTLGEDRLQIDGDLLSGQGTGQAIVTRFGTVQGGDVVLDFGGGDVLRLDGMSNLDAVADHIDII